MSIVRRSRRPADVVRAEALDAAQRLLIEGGPDAVTLKAVSAALGMTHANLIHHFGSAAAMQAALIERMLDNTRDRVRETIAGVRAGRLETRALVDLVFDHVGPALWEQSFYALKPRGRLVNCGNTTGDSVTIPSLGHLFHLGIRIIGSDPYRPHEFDEALTAFRFGHFSSPIDSVFPLAEAAAAHQRLEAGSHIGKVMLQVA